MFLKTLQANLQSATLLPPNSRLVVGVSGGADSVALLHGLIQLRKKLSIELHVATLNHGIRANAQADVEFVANLCQIWHVDYTIGHQDVPQLAQDNQQSLETTARKTRYQFFAQVATAHQAQIVVTAHHANDQAETILMHLIRGSGLNGLRGMSFSTPMPYQMDFTLIRPLLTLSRDEIEHYCHEHNLTFVSDETNLDTDYTRNAIRHTVLPTLEKLNPEFRQSLVRLADIVRVETDFLKQIYEREMEKVQKYSHGWLVAQDIFDNWHEAVQKQFIRMAYIALNKGDKQITWERIQESLTLLKKHDLSLVNELADGWRIRWINTDRKNRAVVMDHVHHPLVPTRYFCYTGAEMALEIDHEYQFDMWQMMISQQEKESYFAKLSFDDHSLVTLRTRRQGDVFYPVGMNGKTKRLKDLFVDEKIPREVRNSIPLVTINNQIAVILLPQKPVYDIRFFTCKDNKYCCYLYTFFSNLA